MPGLMAILRDVAEHEVIQALGNPRRWPRPAQGQHGIPYLAIWTRTGAGRPLIVVLRHLGGLDSMIVAARPMTPLETAQLEQWEQDHA
jgi:hypothetical protein